MNEDIKDTHILIVDDTPTNIRVLGPLLRKAGYRVHVATSGMQAINLARDVNPDLILLDIIMPGLDGYTTCQRLKADPTTQGIPVIFLTARDRDEDMVRGFEVGAVDYVAKPFHSAVLLARVRTQLLLQRQAQHLRALADHDSLTALANRRYFDEFLHREWRRARRQQTSLALILLDIDHFKQYNDTYGHLLGDEALKTIAGLIQQSAQRPGDLAARFGGEEFAIVLGETDLPGALNVAETLRRQVEQQRIPHSGSKTSPVVTASLGVATLPPGADISVEGLLQRADTYLYQAKNAGRNQVGGAP